MKRMQLISKECPPRVHAVYFRSLWNGWVCYDRMKTLLNQCGCLLGCGWDNDALGHYTCCRHYWEFVQAPRPQGLGIITACRSRDFALLVSPKLNNDDAVRLAIGLYALYRTVNHIRFSRTDGVQLNTQKLLRGFARRAVDNHPAKRYLARCVIKKFVIM